ncbi:hypothetical protein CCB80_07580 [Armatimonadetes bacterium Uphvl-Ar1]|jgi:uncharacterized membrane protein|nr:hypothetical protein CCB80_07580 [Armatimonadetes bacterium Uphvl-Ar1]
MDPTSEEKQMAMIAHIGGAVVSLVSGLGFIVPLVLYLTKKDQSRFIGFHALQALVFQGVLFVGAVVLGIAGIFTCGLTWILLPILGIGALVLQIIAGIKANEGQWYLLPIAGDFARKSIGS